MPGTDVSLIKIFNTLDHKHQKICPLCILIHSLLLRDIKGILYMKVTLPTV